MMYTRTWGTSAIKNMPVSTVSSLSLPSSPTPTLPSLPSPPLPSSPDPPLPFPFPSPPLPTFPLPLPLLQADDLLPTGDTVGEDVEQGSRDHGRRSRHRHSDEEEDELGMDVDVKPVIVDGEEVWEPDNEIHSPYCVTDT